MVSQFLVEEAKKNVNSQRELRAVMERNAITSQKLLDNYQLLMVQEGVDESRIRTVTQSRQLDIAKDIIEYAEAGRFDALVIGRRGISSLQELYMEAFHPTSRRIQTLFRSGLSAAMSLRPSFWWLSTGRNTACARLTTWRLH